VALAHPTLPLSSDPRKDSSGRQRGLLGPPSPGAPWLYRLLLRLIRIVGRGLLGFRLELRGGEHLPRDASGRPAGGWIAAGLPHRTWVDPFVLVDLLPVEPRLVFMGDGRAIFRSRLRRLVFRAVGGVVPIWPGSGPAAFASHLEAVASVVAAGAVLVLFPEAGAAVPVERARPLGKGIAYFALRTGAPIVPLVLGGTHELFRGRRIVLDVLPPLSVQELAGLPPGTQLPEPGSPAERALADRVVEALHARTAEAVARAHDSAEPRPGSPRRWRWLTTLFH
jgi:1-acyl-sn-glycerol-3-phosphate acyltransferase